MASSASYNLIPILFFVKVLNKKIEVTNEIVVPSAAPFIPYKGIKIKLANIFVKTIEIMNIDCNHGRFDIKNKL